jgi:hypothetical protein
MQARDAITVRRVFGEPFEKNGVTCRVSICPRRQG